jgi:(E)-4-hydroxy-3-methylbut-2-enyl-diphosphate synthase
LFRELAQDIQVHIDEKLPEWQSRHKGSETLQVAVMGCVVNGPGESRAANIGISLPGAGEEPRAPVFVDGERVKLLSGPNIASEFIEMVESYVETTYGES